MKFTMTGWWFGLSTCVTGETFIGDMVEFRHEQRSGGKATAAR